MNTYPYNAFPFKKLQAANPFKQVLNLFAWKPLFRFSYQIYWSFNLVRYYSQRFLFPTYFTLLKFVSQSTYAGYSIAKLTSYEASAVCKCLWRCKIPARKNSEIFLAGTRWQGVIPYISYPVPVSSCQNVQIITKMYTFLAKMYKFLAKKCTNSLPWQGKCHYNSSPGVVGNKNVNIFPPWGVPARKIIFFDLWNSCHAPNWPDLSCQMVSWAAIVAQRQDALFVWYRLWVHIKQGVGLFLPSFSISLSLGSKTNFTFAEIAKN